MWGMQFYKSIFRRVKIRKFFGKDYEMISLKGKSRIAILYLPLIAVIPFVIWVHYLIFGEIQYFYLILFLIDFLDLPRSFYCSEKGIAVSDLRLIDEGFIIVEKNDLEEIKADEDRGQKDLGFYVNLKYGQEGFKFYLQRDKKEDFYRICEQYNILISSPM